MVAGTEGARRATGVPATVRVGARHHAAAGITAVTRATAVTVSESTGNVMVFRGGKAILEVEKIRLGGSPARGTDLRQT